MKNLFPASRAVLLAAGLVLAAITPAAAEEAAKGTDGGPNDEAFKPTIYAGASAGYANADGNEFGWGIQALGRFFRYGGAQIEYMSFGSQKGNSSGENDGVYFGVMPILPLGNGLMPYAQLGAFIGDAGDDVATGGGLMYHVPIELLDKNNVALVVRTDYKYVNVDDGYHLLTLGFMLGFAK